MSDGNNLCKICNTDPFKYVCPRCNVVYCSVKCYKAVCHSDCSEAFYKECIQEFVKSQEYDPKSRKNMIEILQKVRENDETNFDYASDDSDDVESISERLEGINLDDADSVWEKLTEEERQEFINLIKEGDVSQLLPVWEPWWKKTYPNRKVRFLDENEDVSSFKDNCPTIPKCIPLLSEITKIKPSETIFFNLVNVLSGYIIMARYCNGEHSTMANESVTILLSISKALSENENYLSFDIAFESVMQETINCESITTTEFVRHSMKEDIINILKGPNEEQCVYYVLAALSDIYSVLRNYKNYKAIKGEKGKFSTIFPEINIGTNVYSKALIYKCLKKIKYYQSWSVEYYNPNQFL